MSKAVLVMDMPERCADCPLRSSEKTSYVCCYLTLKNISSTDYYDKKNWANCKITNKCHVGECRPDWCPLRELPEKKETTYPQACYENSYWTDEMKAGFNTCLNEMVGGKS